MPEKYVSVMDEKTRSGVYEKINKKACKPTFVIVLIDKLVPDN